MIPEFHITIGNKEYLLLFFLVPLILFLHFYFLRHSKKRAMKFGNFIAMKRIQGEGKRLSKNFTSLFFLIVILSLLIMLLMDLSLWFESDISTSDYMILLDSGASMNARDVFPDRYTVAKSFAKDIINGIDSAEFGFIGFGGTIIDTSPVDDDKSVILDKIDDMAISNTGTDLALALSTAIDSLRFSNSSKVIILISDGHDTVGMSLSDVLPRIVEEHVKIFSIGVGTLEGGNFLEVPFSDNLISKLNEENLMMLSNISKSEYLRIDENYDINSILSDVESDLSRGFVRFDLNNYFLLMIITILFINWMLDNTRFRVFP